MDGSREQSHVRLPIRRGGKSYPEIVVLGWQVDHSQTLELLERYIPLLELPVERLRVTTDRGIFEGWLGWRVRASMAGAYAFASGPGDHLILINLSRINHSLPKSLEVVVVEELVHMRDRLDGDPRRHAKHGHDRIARRVSALTGATLEEIRAAILSPTRRPARHVYGCPHCGAVVPRRNRGTWSCGKCAPRFDPRFVLRLVSAP